jgi:hypothetical protein
MRGRVMRRGLDKTFLDNNLLRSPEFMALPASARGLWLQLQAVCSSQENGGRLSGAAKWGNGAWRQAMGNGGGLAAFRTLQGLGLARLDGEDVWVEGYHLESEVVYQAKRVIGAKGGRASAAQRAGARSLRETESPQPEGEDSSGDPGSDAQAMLNRRSSTQGGEGKAKKGNAEEGDVGEGDVPEGDVPEGRAAGGGVLSSEVPTRADPGQTDSTASREKAARSPKREPSLDAPDPAAQLAHCLRARSGTRAMPAEKQAFVAYCDSLPAAEVQSACGKLWDYWHADNSPTVTAWLARHGVHR